MFREVSAGHDFNRSIDPAYITAPLNCPPLRPTNHHVFTSDEDVFQSSGFRPNGFARSLMLMANTSPQKPRMDIDLDYAPPVASSHTTLQQTRALPSAVSRPKATKRKSSTQDVSPKKEQQCPIVPGTPVRNAHCGIEQTDLEARARRYQQRNPGVADFDKQWLASFSGKLSDKGEMIDDFRCYVVGCTQLNKRRDHMIVHVGSHLDQRQFKCGEW